MTDEAATGRAGRAVSWRQVSPDGVSEPLVERVPYLELKLEHPGLEPTGHGERFFPDVVPYELDGTPRAHYWRPALAPAADDPDDWALACATTKELTGYGALPAAGPPLVTDDGVGTTLVVGGTVGGETTTRRVESYSAPSLSVDACSDSEVWLTVAGTAHSVPSGQRRRIRLHERRVGVDGDQTTVVPELVVRYPGRRELHHPSPGAAHRLFPSFGIELDAVANPLSVPTAAGELDDEALARRLDVPLSERPYPERVLWQAFAHTAFDPHDDAATELAQLESGHIVCRT